MEFTITRDRAAAGVADAIKAADEGDLTKLDQVRDEYRAKEVSGMPLAEAES